MTFRDGATALLMQWIAFAILAGAVVLAATAPPGTWVRAATADGAPVSYAQTPGPQVGAPASADVTAPGHLGAHGCDHYAGCAPAVVPTATILVGSRSLIGTLATACARLPLDWHAGPATPPPDFRPLAS